MKWLSMTSTLMLFSIASTAFGQTPAAPSRIELPSHRSEIRVAQNTSPSAESTPSNQKELKFKSTNPPSEPAVKTPEMWYYEQSRADFLDPKIKRERAAQQRAALRRSIIASRKWNGYSAMRPVVSGDMVNGPALPRGHAYQLWAPGIFYQPFTFQAPAVAPRASRRAIW